MMSSFELVFISVSASRTSYGAFYHHFPFVRDFRKYLNNLLCMLLWHILAHSSSWIFFLLCLLNAGLNEISQQTSSKMFHELEYFRFLRKKRKF